MKPLRESSEIIWRNGAGGALNIVPSPKDQRLKGGVGCYSGFHNRAGPKQALLFPHSINIVGETPGRQVENDCV